MATTVNELINELQREVAFKLTTGDVPFMNGNTPIEVTPVLCGGSGNYWCELCIKETE